MKEIPVTFKNKGQRIRGVLHIPSTETKSIVIFAHGFTGHKREVQIVNCARSLAEHGVAALRFDFRGSGDSGGFFRNMTISSEVSDLEKAIDFVKKKGYRRIGLIGHSLGGAVVILTNKKNVDAICLWEPTMAPIALRKWFGKRIKLIEKDGYALISKGGRGIEFIIGRPIWNEIKNRFPDLSDDLISIRVPKSIVYGDDNRRWLDIFGYGVNRKLKSPDNNLKAIKNADHIFSLYRHEKQLIDYTVKWFRKWLK